MGERKRLTKAQAGKRRLRIILIVVGVVLIAAIVGVVALRRMVTQQFASTTGSEAISAEVTTGSISTTISGSGTLSDEDVTTVEVPAGVTVEEVCVSSGDSVEEGDLLASVDAASVIAAMADLQTQLDELDAEIEEAEDDEVDDTISAGMDGRVKLIYAEEGDDVASVMYESGALLLLSLDGYMAVDIDAGDLAEGDSVTVTGGDGSGYTGTVETVSGGTATVLLTDDGTAYGDSVTVTDENGDTCGIGVLYIHQELRVTGYAGTVESVSVSENESVSAGDALFTLTDTSYTASYDSLLEQREELEEELAELIVIYKEGGVYAHTSGTVSSVDSDSSSSATNAMGSSSSATDAMGSSGSAATSLLTISSDETMTISVSVDETNILSLEVGQEASVSVDSISDETFTGTVTEIDTTATSSGGVTAYTAVVTVEKTESMLSGMSASVTITIEGVEDALLIPEDALVTTSSTAYVYTSYDETTGELGDMVEVTYGLSNGTYVEITSGLSEGDVVYYFDSSDDSDMMSFGTMDFSDMSSFGDIDFSDVSGFSDMGGFSNAGGDMAGGGPN